MMTESLFLMAYPLGKRYYNNCAKVKLATKCFGGTEKHTSPRDMEALAGDIDLLMSFQFAGVLHCRMLL